MVAQHNQALAQNTISLARLQDSARASRALVSEDGMKLITNSAEGNDKRLLVTYKYSILQRHVTLERMDGSCSTKDVFVSHFSFQHFQWFHCLWSGWDRGEDKNIFGFLRMLKSQRTAGCRLYA